MPKRKSKNFSSNVQWLRQQIAADKKRRALRDKPSTRPGKVLTGLDPRMEYFGPFPQPRPKSRRKSRRSPKSRKKSRKECRNN